MTSLPEENDWVSPTSPKTRRGSRKKSLRRNTSEERPTPKKKVGPTTPDERRETKGTTLDERREAKGLESKQESLVGLPFFLGRSLGVPVKDIEILIESYHRSRVSLEPLAEVVLAKVLKKLSWFSLPKSCMGGGSALKRFSVEEIVSWMPKFQRFFDPDDALFLFADDPLENNISHLERWVGIVLEEICKNPEIPNLVVTIYSQRPELPVVVTKLMIEHLSHDPNYSFAMTVNRLYPHLSVTDALSFLKRRPPKSIKGYSREERQELTNAMLIAKKLTFPEVT